MIGYLQGEIIEHADGKMLVGIGDKKASGVIGYHVTVPQSATYGGYGPGRSIELFVHTHVREEAFDLYGFVSKYERTLFLTLLSVSGVGPKTALGILSMVDPEQLVQAITEGDTAFLARAPGIGKKTAERVVVELRDSIRKKLESGALSPRTAASASMLSNSAISRPGDSDAIQDAKAALLGLGYRELEIQQLLKKVLHETDGKNHRAEDLIRNALRHLG